MHFVNCPLCNKNEYREVFVLKTDRVLKLLDIRGFQNRKVMCRICGLVYQNPQLNTVEINELYTRLARSRKAGYLSDTPQPDYLRWKELKALRDFEWLERNVNLNSLPNRKILDIGCAEGSLLKLFRERKWDATGVEPTVSYAQFGRTEYGLNIINGFLNEAGFSEPEFDLISFLNVLEHSDEPLKFLKSVNRIVRDNGYVYVEVPNIYRPKEDFEEFIGSQHLTLFSPSTLALMLAKTGFEPINIDDRAVFLRALAQKKGVSLSAQTRVKPANAPDNYRKVSKVLQKHRIKFFFFRLNNRMRAFIEKALIAIFGEGRSRRAITFLKRLRIAR